MKKIIVILFVAGTFFLCLAKDSTANEVKVKEIAGTKHIFNPAVPLKGKVELKLKKSLVIEPGVKNDLLPDFFFDDFVEDKQGNVYLIDGKNVKIYKFSTRGKFIKSFLEKGQGPGEFDTYPRIQVIGTRLCVIGERDKKIAWYSLDGTLLKEVRLKKYYLSTIPIDTNKFIAKVDKYSSKEMIDFTRSFGLFNIKEDNVLEFSQAKNIGRFFVDYGKRALSIIPAPGIVPDFVYDYDHNSGRVYYSLNKDYKIFVKNLGGRPELVIHKENTPPLLKSAGKDAIVKNYGNIPPALQKAIVNRLPSRRCAIESMTVLPGGFLMVKNIRGYRERDLDIFSGDGRYLYLVELPKEMDLDMVKFYNGTLSGIENKDDTVIYNRYQIESIPGVFRHK